MSLRKALRSDEVVNSYRHSTLFSTFDDQNTNTPNPTPPPPKKIIQINKTWKQFFFFFLHIFPLLSILTVCIGFSPSLIHIVNVYTFRCAVTSGNVNVLVNFKEDYRSLVTDICPTKLFILALFGTSWQFLVQGFNIFFGFKPNFERYCFQHNMVYCWHNTHFDCAPWPHICRIRF